MSWPAEVPANRRVGEARAERVWPVPDVLTVGVERQGVEVLRSMSLGDRNRRQDLSGPGRHPGSGRIHGIGIRA
jgi:hypothetical protein